MRNKTQVSYLGGRVVTMSYDSANRLDVVSSNAVSLADYAYDGRGMVSGIIFGNGVVMSNAIDSAGLKSFVPSVSQAVMKPPP